MRKNLRASFLTLCTALLALVVLAPPAHSGYQPTPTGTGFVTVTSGLQNAAAKAFPSGTGFYHATAGALDTATTTIPLTSSELTGLLPVAKGGTGVSAVGADGTFLRSNGTGYVTGYYADPSVDGLRLTGTSGNPIPATDPGVVATIYLTPYRSGWISLYDGNGWVLRSTSEISIPLGTLLNNTNYDVFVYYSGSVGCLISQAWASSTVRTDQLSRQDGVLVKTGAPAQRYVGTFRTVSTTQTNDAVTQRFIYNEYNQTRRSLFVFDSTASWTYASTTVRQVRATATNRVDIVVGQTTPIEASATALSAGGASGIRVLPGVGIDSTVTNVATNVGSASSTNFASETNLNRAEYDGAITAGYHAINWLESLNVATSSTIYGLAGGSASNMRVRATM